MVLPEKNLLFLFAGLLALLAVLGTVWLAYFSAPPESPEPGPGPQPPRPPPENGTPPPQPPSGLLNIVVIYTDDQRWDTLWAMPNVQRELQEKGVTFENAFQTTPLCCPSRASFLSGGFYAFNTGVLANKLPHGSVTRFFDEENIGVLLQKKGYTTAIMGKYLNGYSSIAPYIPPGWDLFLDTPAGNQVTFGSTTPEGSGTGTFIRNREYNTYYLRDRAIEFISENSGKPFFLLVTPRAVHSPANPAPEDETLFSDYLHDAPSINEANLQDKPEYINAAKNNGLGRERHGDDEEGEQNEPDNSSNEEFIRNQIRSLQAVDRMVKAIVDRLSQEELLDRTVIIFASDNGLMWGEHWLFKDKGNPYEESIRVPLVVRMPQTGKKTVNSLIAVNLDVPATILRLAGIQLQTDGLDLTPLLFGEQVQWRNGLTLQGWPEKANDVPKNTEVPSWAAWRTEKYKYVEYETGEKEFYDLENDPFELESKHDQPQFQELMNGFANEMVRGVSAVIPGDLSAGLNQPYEFSFEAIWGKPPYTWFVTDDIPVLKQNEKNMVGDCTRKLPAGLLLDNSGVLHGTPLNRQTCAFIIAVSDSQVSPYTKKQNDYRFKVIIGVE